MKRTSHPDDATLQAWLEEDAGAELDDHVEHCEICAGRLEDLERSMNPVTTALEEATRPPDDLRARLDARFAKIALERETMQVVADLFGLGFRTARHLIEPEGPERDA